MATYKKKSCSMLDFIMAAAANETTAHYDGGELTREEWCRIRRMGTPEEIAEAVEKMEAAGGYDNLA